MLSLNRGLPLLFLFLLIVPFTVFAHGEELPGPHGGFIRMPGAFHTEVVPEKAGFKIVLLDIDFKHPLVNNSSVIVHIQKNKQTHALKCKVEADHFFCPAKKTWMQEKGMLLVEAEREKAKGAIVSYPLPLH